MRYRAYDDQGRELYRGEMISSRRYRSARRVGWIQGIAFAASWAYLAALTGLPLPLALMIGALFGQILLNAIQRNYSRKIWAFAEQERAREKLAEKLTPEEAERRKAKAERDLKIERLKIHIEAGLPWLDFATGEVVPVALLSDRLAELEHEAEEIERKERNQARSAEVASPIKLDMDPGGQWVVQGTGLLRGRPANPRAARRAKLASGLVIELTNADLDKIRSAGEWIGPGWAMTLPSGYKLTGDEVSALAADLRKIETDRPEPCEHGCPAHLECAYCMIDLGTPEGIERGQALLDDHQIQSRARAKSIKHRPVRVIEEEIQHVELGLIHRHITPDTARSLLRDFEHELRLAREAETDGDD